MADRTIPARRKTSSHRVRRVYLLPNLLTAFNLFLGFWAIAAVMRGDIDRACWLVFLAILLDGLDGAMARLTHTQSEFGLQFDSLSDLVSFGLAPAVAAFRTMSNMTELEKPGRLVLGVCGLFAVCGALRLARYNVQVKDVEKRSFVGLPIPASAGMLVFSILMMREHRDAMPFFVHHSVIPPLFLFLISGLAILMVSQLPYPSLPRLLRIQRRTSFDSLVFMIFVAVLLLAIWSELRVQIIFAVGVLYVFGTPLLYSLSSITGRRRAGQPVGSRPAIDETQTGSPR
ncbi:CDP-diacylglycerol--serine O-phosphatidyltransferase [Candidatus Sumerlaeota bacterium]|nr:CDP-diacylglycerol--serine O-phosphatidyltransferase [Candidatus Sumerlaeota bacterium]